MKKVLLLGAGLVTRPLVNYLLEAGDIKLIIASRTLQKAKDLLETHPRGEAREFDITTQEGKLGALIEEVDLVISLLPYIYHVKVANECLLKKKHLVTTSYVSKAMQDLDEQAKNAGLLFLNEIGLDPGIDHMSAMKIIDHVHEKGGEIVSFRSFCGGLPAPEANTNPFGYKFSWSPRGVLLAGRNNARYLEDAKEINIPGEELFSNYSHQHIEGLDKLEAYPNRDSVPYVDIYKIKETKTMFRGTFRNLGWCDTLKSISKLGFLKEDKLSDLNNLTYSGYFRKTTGIKDVDLKKATALFLNISENEAPIKNLEWLGFFSNEPLKTKSDTPIDILVDIMQEKLAYKDGERDMIILFHDFTAYYSKTDKKERITSTLIDYGVPHGDSSMSRTVGLPAAIATKLILQDKIKLTGVQIPVEKEIYEPVLMELELQGILCRERVETINNSPSIV